MRICCRHVFGRFVLVLYGILGISTGQSYAVNKFIYLRVVLGYSKSSQDLDKNNYHMVNESQNKVKFSQFSFQTHSTNKNLFLLQQLDKLHNQLYRMMIIAMGGPVPLQTIRKLYLQAPVYTATNAVKHTTAPLIHLSHLVFSTFRK